MWRSNAKLLGSVVGLGVVMAASVPSAHAAEALFTPDCTTDNLLARKPPAQRQDLRGNFWLVTDEAVAPEGAQWDSPVAIVLDTPAGSVTYDLGQPTTVSAFYVQADANDTYKIFGSLDGTPNSFKLLVEVDTVPGHGLRGRTPTINPTLVRFVRIGEGLGDGFYSISEFAAYCRPPTPFPPQFRKVDAPAARVPDVPWWQMYWWNNDGERALRDAARAGRHGPHPVGHQPAREEHARRARQAAAAAADGGRDPVLRRLLELRLLPLPQLHPRLGHLSLLHRREVLPRAVVRPSLRLRLRRRLRGAGPAPPRRAAQDHEPAHQHDGPDDRGAGPPRALQGSLHARALAGVQEATSPTSAPRTA